jgi:hypothetical protein
MLLKFKLLKDCLEFSDQFSDLDSAPGQATTANQPQAKPIRQQDQEGTVTYIAQLLVRKLENCIASSSDGGKLLEGLEQLDLLSEQNS